MVAAGGVGRDAAAFSAAAAAPTIAAVRDGFLGASSTGRSSRAAFAIGRSSMAPAGSGAPMIFGLACATAGDSFGALSRCFFSTSCRCLSRRRSSRRSRYRPSIACQRSRTSWAMAENSRPKENCVDRMMARKRSVRIRMIEPVRLRYSAERAGKPVPHVSARAERLARHVERAERERQEGRHAREEQPGADQLRVRGVESRGTRSSASRGRPSRSE